MATSGSANFEQSAAEIIKDALLLVSGIEDDESPSASQYAIALRALNRMTKAWSVKGLKVWCWKDTTLDLVAGTASYELGPTGDKVINRPLRIENVRRVVDSAETEIRVASRQEYLSQPSKDSPGKPVYVYYDSQLGNGALYVWPTPDSSSDDLKFSYKSYIEDFDTQGNTPYFPQEWAEALVYGLAWRLCPMYEVTGQDLANISDMAKQFLEEAETSDQDDASVSLTPEYVQ